MPTTECHECGGPLTEVNESHSLSLYAHTDKWRQCEWCGEIFTHGIPDDHDDGMAFYDVERGLKYKPDEQCCERPLQPTKVWLSEKDVQFKCPCCYRVEVPDPEDVS